MDSCPFKCCVCVCEYVYSLSYYKSLSNKHPPFYTHLPESLSKLCPSHFVALCSQPQLYMSDSLLSKAAQLKGFIQILLSLYCFSRLSSCVVMLLNSSSAAFTSLLTESSKRPVGFFSEEQLSPSCSGGNYDSGI